MCKEFQLNKYKEAIRSEKIYKRKLENKELCYAMWRRNAIFVSKFTFGAFGLTLTATSFLTSNDFKRKTMLEVMQGKISLREKEILDFENERLIDAYKDQCIDGTLRCLDSENKKLKAELDRLQLLDENDKKNNKFTILKFIKYFYHLISCIFTFIIVSLLTFLLLEFVDIGYHLAILDQPFFNF